MNREEKIILDKIARKAINSTIPKYEKYREVLNERLDEITTKISNIIINNVSSLYDPTCGINPELIFQMSIDNYIMKEFCKEISNGNIDLEIMFIEEYTTITEFIMRKLKYEGNSEDVIIEAIENYNGESTFKMHISKTVKEKRDSLKLKIK